MAGRRCCLRSGNARAAIQKLLSKVVLPRVNFLTLGLKFSMFISANPYREGRKIDCAALRT